MLATMKIEKTDKGHSNESSVSEQEKHMKHCDHIFCLTPRVRALLHKQYTPNEVN